jgi:hypothetical protein
LTAVIKPSYRSVHTVRRTRCTLFSVSPSHFEAVRKYILNQEEHHYKETFQEEVLRLLQRYRVQYDERYLWD